MRVDRPRVLGGTATRGVGFRGLFCLPGGCTSAAADFRHSTPAWCDRASTPQYHAALAISNRPTLLAAVGGIGLVVIIWLMMARGF
jgi:hypothetical protein